MQHVALDNDAVLSETIITNDKGWKLIDLIVKRNLKVKMFPGLPQWT